MIVEEILYGELKRLAGDYLTTKDNLPAIFYRQSPPDTDTWTGEAQYPRITYYIEYKYNPERQTSGTLYIDIHQMQDRELSSEDIAEAIKPHLDELFITDDYGTLSFNWNRNEAWNVGTESPQVANTTMVFEVYDYPVTKIDDMDPVYSMSLYTKALLPDVKVIGIDKMPNVYRGDVAYYYIESYSVDVDTSIYAVTWIDAVIRGQMGGSNVDANLVTLNHKIALDQEVILEDTSPFFIERFRTQKANRTGQITINGRYGVLRQKDLNIPPLTTIGLTENINTRRLLIGRKE